MKTRTITVIPSHNLLSGGSRTDGHSLLTTKLFLDIIIASIILLFFAPLLALIPDSPDRLGRQDRRPRKRWANCRFVLSPVGSVRIQPPDPA